jgi:hypothetical protein
MNTETKAKLLSLGKLLTMEELEIDLREAEKEEYHVKGNLGIVEASRICMLIGAKNAIEGAPANLAALELLKAVIELLNKEENKNPLKD